MEPGTVIEVALFRLAAGADSESFVAAAATAGEWLRRQAGFVRRELGQEDGGQWVDLVHWTTLDAAQDAANRISSAAEPRPMMGMIDPESVRLLHPRVVSRLE